MRKELRVATLVLAVSLVACGKAPEQVAAKQDVAAKTPDLQGAPQSYKRMRFVSDIEQGKSAAKHTMTARHVPAETQKMVEPERFASLASQPLSAVSTQAAPAVQEQVTVVIGPMHLPEPSHAITMEDDGVLDHRGRIDGLASHVVIRGGHADTDKCDPRSEAAARGLLSGRPDSRMPLMPSSGAFGGIRR